MTRTLADMTPGERQSCVGMWCDLETNRGTQQVVLYEMAENHETGPVAYRLSFTSRHEILGFDPRELIPRFDLPRAWNPDGTPPVHADLPEPKWPGFWEVDGLEINVVDKDGEVNLDWREGDYYRGEDRSLWLNRQQVLAIIAAAKLAEERK